VILIDENLSAKLTRSLLDLFPAVIHVKQLGLVRTSDREIWAFAQAHKIAAILTADSDLKMLASQFGTPPKVIHIVECNFSTKQAEDLLRREAIRISEFLTSEQPGPPAQTLTLPLS
jgi:predicted nuclease of predicted toxin-antitoxin system